MFCKDVLMPGGYVLIYGTVMSYALWSEAFNKYPFTWKPHPECITITENIHHRNCSIFSQQNMDSETSTPVVSNVKCNLNFRFSNPYQT